MCKTSVSTNSCAEDLIDLCFLVTDLCLLEEKRSYVVARLEVWDDLNAASILQGFEADKSTNSARAEGRLRTSEATSL